MLNLHLHDRLGSPRHGSPQRLSPRHGSPQRKAVVTNGTIPGAYRYGPSAPTFPLPPMLNGLYPLHGYADSVQSMGSLGSIDEPYYRNGNGAASNGNGNGNGTLSKNDFAKFVQFFRQASPYIEGHRGKVFVIVVPGTVTYDRALLQTIMSDVALLHGLGVQIVLVVGSQKMIDQQLVQRGLEPKYVGGFRVTDQRALNVCAEAAGQVRLSCEQFLSKGPAIPMIRRHAKSDREIHFEPALRVISGNYVTAKRRGIIDGVDFGFSGDVRFVLKEDIKRQLEFGNIVILGNLGFTASGEVLNCDVHDVGLRTAIDLQADKLFYLHAGEVEKLQLPHWLPLSDAKDMLLKKMKESCHAMMGSQDDSAPTACPAFATATMDADINVYSSTPQVGDLSKEARARMLQMTDDELVMNPDAWGTQGFPRCVASCVIACSKGVKRAHLLDARIDGGLLLELYNRDGVGTMISTDFYEGIRKARPSDLDMIVGLFKPLEKEGILVKRSRDEIADLLPHLTVISRERKTSPSPAAEQVMGCALVLPLGCTPDGVSVAEFGAFCIDAAHRGSGRGDSLLDYLEQDARRAGIRRLVLLTTRTADWFEQRDFRLCGPASTSELLPEGRRSKINPARNSQLYVKHLEELDVDTEGPGKRIGF